MAAIGTLYDLLGVAFDADTAAIRAAYRRAARANHPDTQGEARSSQMAEINAAWRVLGDPALRREYDRSLSSPVTGETRAAEADEPVFVEPRYNPLARYQDPPRFPWRFMGVLLALGVLAMIVGMATAADPLPPTLDNVLHPGECVAIEANGDAAERLCSDPHDGTVVVLLTTTGATCPEGSEPHRDHQGMGTACVRLG